MNARRPLGVSLIGIQDTVGSYVRYIQNNEIVCFAQHYSMVMTTYLRNKERLKNNKQTLSDFAKLTPFAVSDLEFNLRTTTSSWTDRSQSRTASSSDFKPEHMGDDARWSLAPSMFHMFIFYKVWIVIISLVRGLHIPANSLIICIIIFSLSLQFPEYKRFLSSC